jgi:hypothetical protein
MLFQAGTQPGSHQTVGIRVAVSRIGGLDRHKDDACRSALAAHYRSARSLYVTAAFTAFPPHVVVLLSAPAGLCPHEDVETKIEVVNAEAPQRDLVDGSRWDHRRNPNA